MALRHKKAVQDPDFLRAFEDVEPAKCIYLLASHFREILKNILSYNKNEVTTI